MISLENVTVDIPVQIQGKRAVLHNAITEMVGGVVTSRSASRLNVRALDNVSFTLPSGERLGLIGHNGAGKTTLLKTIAGLYPISSGTIEVEGSVRTFFNLSAGLDASQSGLKNIKNVALFYTPDIAEIEHMVPEIIEFSELGDFIDMPVSTYSAGMLARLIVSIALNFGGENLIMDEMLGAGDASFMKKVNARVHKMMESSKSLLFASHATEIVHQLCNKVIWLEKGRIKMMGDATYVVEEFNKTL